MKVLQVVAASDSDSAAHDGALAWLQHAKRSAAIHPHLLLQGDAVRYALLTPELAALIDAGAIVYLVRDDADERGITSAALASHVQLIARADVPALYAAHDQIWLW